MLIAQLSDVHVGGTRYREELLRTAIAEINAAEPDIVFMAGDLTDDGYPDQYPVAKEELEAIACEHVVYVPGNHDARNVGYVLFEDTFGPRDTQRRLQCGGLDVALVAVDSSKPDLDEVEDGKFGVELCVPGGERQTLGEYPRDWPEELSARHIDPFVRPQRGGSLAND